MAELSGTVRFRTGALTQNTVDADANLLQARQRPAPSQALRKRYRSTDSPRAWRRSSYSLLSNWSKELTPSRLSTVPSCASAR